MRRGVVIASGGYESSPELVERFEALPGWQSMFPESIRGDGLVMATEHGAAVHMISNNLSIFLGFRNPEEAPGGTALCRLSGTQELPSPHTIVVNRHGRRFADESFFQAVAPTLRQFDVVTREQPNLPCWLIFDQRYVGRHSFGGRPPGAEIPPWVERAPTLDALATRLGIAAEGLVDTVQRFNADVDDGTDRQFGVGSQPGASTAMHPQRRWVRSRKRRSTASACTQQRCLPLACWPNFSRAYCMLGAIRSPVSMRSAMPRRARRRAPATRPASPSRQA